MPELCWPSQAGVGYQVFDTTESELRLSGGKSNGCRGNVDDRPFGLPGMSAPRGNEENRPDWNERGDGALVKVDCFRIDDVPVLLPELMLTPLDDGRSSRTPQQLGSANEASGRAFNNEPSAVTAPRSHRK